jgi:hypothetical protein
MNEYTQALERVAKISAQIYKVTSLAFARTKQICCSHGNCPSYPTHAWWCDKCWFELKDALDELESFQETALKEIFAGSQSAQQGREPGKGNVPEPVKSE